MRRAVIVLVVLAATTLGVTLAARPADARPGCRFSSCVKVKVPSIHCGGIFYSTCEIVRRPVLYR